MNECDERITQKGACILTCMLRAPVLGQLKPGRLAFVASETVEHLLQIGRCSSDCRKGFG
jgi:hypothetical protein